MMILILILFGFAIYYFLKDNKSFERKDNKASMDSIEILKLRYVNGEIDHETYKKMLEALNS